MELATHVIAMNGTRVGTNVQLTFIIHQQLTYKNMSNSVHNFKSRSCMNFQGNRLIVRVQSDTSIYIVYLKAYANHLVGVQVIATINLQCNSL